MSTFLPILPEILLLLLGVLLLILDPFLKKDTDRRSFLGWFTAAGSWSSWPYASFLPDPQSTRTRCVWRNAALRLAGVPVQDVLCSGGRRDGPVFHGYGKIEATRRSLSADAGGRNRACA